MIEKNVGVDEDPQSDVIEKKASDGSENAEQIVDVPQEPTPQTYAGDIEKFRGKSVEDIAKSYQELEKLQSQQASKLGEIEKERDAYRQWYATVQQQQAQMRQPAQPQQPDTSYDDKFYESPTQAARALMQEELMKYQQASQVQSAYKMAPFARDKAKQLFPGAFIGVEDNEVETLLASGVRSGMINPAFIENPEGWAAVANMIQGQKNKYTYPSQSHNPTMPEGTNLPPATKMGASQTAPSLPKEAEELLRVWGADDAETKKQVAKDLEDYRKDMYGGGQ